MGWNFFDTTGSTKKVTLTGSLDLPIGTVVPFASDTVPSGWMLCDGSAVSRTLNADLFGTLGTSFGAGDGSTTFNLPDLRGRAPVGKNASTFATLGATGGVEAVTLTSAQSGMPAHAHSMSGNAGGGGGVNTFSVQAFGPVNFQINNTGTASGVNASSSHTNLQPYQVLNYIIKVAHVASAVSGGVDLSGREVTGGYAQLTANSNGAGDKIAITIVGNGVNAVMLEGWCQAVSSTGGFSLPNEIYLQIWDGPSLSGGTMVSQAVSSNYQSGEMQHLACRRRINAFNGSKTFYLTVNNETLGNTPLLQATAGSPAFIRATWV